MPASKRREALPTWTRSGERIFEPDPLCLMALAEMIEKETRTSTRRAWKLAVLIDRAYRGIESE